MHTLDDEADNLFYVKVRQDEAKFLVDTGASVSVVDPKVLNPNLLRYPARVTVSGISNEDIKITECCDLNVFKNKIHRFLILPLDIEYDGIIGIDF